MKTDIITIHSDLKGREEALETADRFIAYNGISGKQAMHIRLLTEEAVCMVHGIMDGFMGRLWLESDKENGKTVCRICVTADASVSEYQEDRLLSVSTSGKNEDAKGILGKIRELIRTSGQRPIVTFDTDTSDLDDWYYMGMPHGESRMIDDYYIGYWSLDCYRESVNQKPAGTITEDMHDELEKSIIAKLADDVKVWLRADTTKVVIEKSLG